MPMQHPPEIQVQLIHIDGPMKGEIREFSGPVITLGRHPDNDVVFPAGMTVISRRHAEIRREGNRFRLLDHSTNGTYVNGRRVEDTFLKDGDVLIIGTDGPKISFLTTVATGAAPDRPGNDEQERQPSPEIPESQPDAPPPSLPKEPAVQSPRPAAPAGDSNQPAPQPATMARPLVIQYGAVLKTFRSLPVTIGRGPDCDFPLDHPAMQPRHARIFFDQGQYRVSDLTGRGLVTVDRQPAGEGAVLAPDSRLDLSPSGPAFQFLGDGRLAELPDAGPQGARRDARPAAAAPARPSSAAGRGRKIVLIAILLVLAGLAAGAALLFFAGGQGADTAGPLMRRLHEAGEYLRSLLSG